MKNWENVIALEINSNILQKFSENSNTTAHGLKDFVYVLC